MHHKLTYTVQKKCPQVNNYKRGDDAKLWAHIWKNNIYRLPKKCGNFLSSLGHISFSGMPLLHGVRPAECALYEKLFLKTKQNNSSNGPVDRHKADWAACKIACSFWYPISLHWSPLRWWHSSVWVVIRVQNWRRADSSLPLCASFQAKTQNNNYY